MDIKFVTINDVTDDQILCRFIEVPGLAWTTRELRAAGRYLDRVIGHLP